MAVQVSDVTRRIGVSLVGAAAVAALVAGCSSSGGGSPAGSTTTASSGGASSTAASTPAGGGASSSSSSASGGGGSTVADPFCAGFAHADLSAISSASGAAEAVKAWDQYAKDAPSEIKANVEEIDKYLHDAVDGKYNDVAKIASKIGVDGQKIGTYYATHCSG